jgi:hypothetical protein
VNESAALCAKNNAGVDNSLPGYALETFEYYVKYSDPTAAVTIGNQLLNKAWEPASDSRIKPSLYQGGDASINVTKALAIGLTRVTRFENRSESLFGQCTLLTCNSGVTPAGIGSIVGRKSITTGADRLALTFKPSARVTVSAETYRFHNIANLTYFESKYYVLRKNVYNPYLGVQFVDERQSGSAILGRVQNQTVGLQLGVTPVRNLLFTVGADQAPWNYDIVSAASAAAATAPYFLAAGGTNALVAGGVNGAAVNAVKVGPGRYKVAYGGIASPYSDSYASDPLYTTSISQGMVDRRSAGFALKGRSRSPPPISGSSRSPARRPTTMTRRLPATGPTNSTPISPMVLIRCGPERTADSRCASALRIARSRRCPITSNTSGTSCSTASDPSPPTLAIPTAEPAFGLRLRLFQTLVRPGTTTARFTGLRTTR